MALKIKEAIEALKAGKRIMRVSSDPPVDLCDHLDDSPSKRGYYQLCHQDMVGHFVPVCSCAAEVKRVMTLEQFESRGSYAYLNFAEYEEPTRH